MTRLRRIAARLLDALAERLDVGGQWSRLTDFEEDE